MDKYAEEKKKGIINCLKRFTDLHYRLIDIGNISKKIETLKINNNYYYVK